MIWDKPCPLGRKHVSHLIRANAAVQRGVRRWLAEVESKHCTDVEQHHLGCCSHLLLFYRLLFFSFLFSFFFFSILCLPLPPNSTGTRADLGSGFLKRELATASGLRLKPRLQDFFSLRFVFTGVKVQMSKRAPSDCKLRSGQRFVGGEK